jgi:hypothetical protein
LVHLDELTPTERIIGALDGLSALAAELVGRSVAVIATAGGFDRIAPTAVPRSSIIVSDEPLSHETNYRTEFIAVLNNQPQGGFVTRQPTDDIGIESGNYWSDDGFGSVFQPWNSQTGNTRRRGGQCCYPVQRGLW